MRMIDEDEVGLKGMLKTKCFCDLDTDLQSRKVKRKGVCTSTIIVQFIGTKYVQICKAIWSELTTQRTIRHIKGMPKTLVFL